MMAISLPISQGFERGWETSAMIVARGTLAFLASLWLVNVMPFEQLLLTLRRLRVPALVVAILAFMYRYVFVVWDELDKLRTAHRARSFGRASLWFRWKTLAQMIGMLLGGFIWGIIGDKYGRLSVLFGSIILYSTATFANAYAPNFEWYFLLRFLAGV